MKYKDKPDLELINQVKLGVDPNGAIKELINRHSGIFISVANNICPHKDCVEFRDLIKDKDFYIYKSILKYDPSKGTKFCTFLGNEARWATLNLITFKNKVRSEPLKESMAHHAVSGQSRKIIGKSALESVRQLAEQEEDRRVAIIFKLRYLEGNKNKVMPWKKIAKKLDLSIQGCINIHNNFIEKIKNKVL